MFWNLIKITIFFTAAERDDWFPAKNAYLCGAHFLPDDYKKSATLGSALRRRELIDSAIPSIFDFGQILRSKRSSRKRKKEVSTKMMKTEFVPVIIPLTKRKIKQIQEEKQDEFQEKRRKIRERMIQELRMSSNPDDRVFAEIVAE